MFQFRLSELAPFIGILTGICAVLGIIQMYRVGDERKDGIFWLTGMILMLIGIAGSFALLAYYPLSLASSTGSAFLIFAIHHIVYSVQARKPAINYFAGVALILLGVLGILLSFSSITL